MSWNVQHTTSVLLDALPYAVLIVSADGTIVLRNAAANDMLPEGDAIASVLAGGEGACPFDWRREVGAISPGGSTLHRNMALKGRPGRQFVADLYIRPLDALPAPDNALALVVAQDVSARVSMERRLAATERLTAMGKLSARVAHELNNPLDGVLRYVGLAQRTAGPEAQAHLDGARKGLMRMADVIRDMMSQAGPLLAWGETAKLSSLLDEAVTTMQPRADALGVAMVCDLSAEPATAPGSLYQVFCNVIKNSLDAMPNGGALTIRLRRELQEIVLDFADTGCGFAPQEAQRIFEPFYTTKPDSGGSGLGLAICRDLVERVGGSISAACGPSRGAVITIRMPAADR